MEGTIITTENSKSFNLTEALEGTPVGVLNSYFIGQLIKRGNLFVVYYKGTSYNVSNSGVINNGDYVGKQLVLVVAHIAEKATEHTRASTDSNDEETSISNLNPRDEFAMIALKAILYKQSNIDSISDSAIKFCCDASYRWAQGMIESSIRARKLYKDDETNTEESGT